MLNLFVKATSIRVEEGVFHDKETESVLEDKNLTDSEISQELIDKDHPTENVKPSEIDFLRKEPDLVTQIDFTLLVTLLDCPRKLRKKQQLL